jgi:esterase/lipase superfamily enzyme
VHLIAHSMGNRGLIRALQRITTIAHRELGVRFGQIVLAAPDIDGDLFRGLISVFHDISERTTLYVSRNDRAIAASKWLHSYDRIGLSPPVAVFEGIDTIEVPKFNVFDLLGHGYFAEAEALLSDLYHLIRHDAHPKDRQRLLQAMTSDGSSYWVMES